MSNLGPDVVPFPSCGDDAVQDGAFDWVALDTDGAVADLSAYGCGYMEVTWIPAAATDVLLYACFATQTEAEAGFDVATDSGSPGALVATCPGFLAAGYVQRLVNPARPWIRVEASAGTGRCVVRRANLERAWG